MPIAERDGDRIVLDTAYRERELVKQIPGAKWDTDRNTWWLPLSWAGCVQTRAVFGESLQVGVQLSAWAAAEIEERVAPCLALRTTEDAPELAFLSALRPFQRAGVQFMVRARQALNADEMRLGKTVQTIAALEVLGDDAYPALVVCPNSMKFAWAEEHDTEGRLSGGFARWAPNRRVSIIHGGASARRAQIAAVRDGAADVAIINWEGLRGHTRLEGYGSVKLEDDEKVPKELNEVRWRTVVADEAHRAKDPRARQTRALWWVGRDAEYRFALTGTPVGNSPEDIWTLMRFVAPLEFPAKTRFIERYALQSWSIYGFLEVVGVRPEVKEELFKILDPRLIRRTRAAVSAQLPAVSSVRVVELGSKQRKAYDSLRKEMLAELDSGVLVAKNPLSRTTRLVQFASAYGEIDEDGGLLLTEPSCKVDALEEIVAELGTQRALVFAESRQLIELATRRLLKAGVKCAQVTGAVEAAQRAANVAAFQQGRTQVLLLTLGAGGEGLTLHAADVSIFLQRSWSAIKNRQAEDRMVDAMSAEPVPKSVIDVVAQDTIEERVLAVRAEKGDRLEEIVRDEETLRVWLAK